MTDKNREMLFAVALSIMNEQAGAGLWKVLNAKTLPSETADHLFSRKEPRTQDFIARRYSSDVMKAAEEIMDESENRKIMMTSFWDSGYPPLLREISRPPLLLYHSAPVNDHPKIAIVGTRNCSAAGGEMAGSFAASLACRGVTVVSGMAAGIDRAAHSGALEGGGSTIGVMANGLDIMYPTRNRDLYQRVLAEEGSCLLSEYPPGVYAGKFTFVRRNRIISGLSHGTLIAEAPERSGALITAEYALNQNREVFACSGHSADPRFLGCHRLIQKGAFLATGAEDILREMGWAPHGEEKHAKTEMREEAGGREVADLHQVPLPGLFPREDGGLYKRIINELSSGERDIDSLVRSLGSPAAEIQETLLCLELEGRVKRSGNRVMKTKAGVKGS